jgi:hypothetical protein
MPSNYYSNQFGTGIDQIGLPHPRRKSAHGVAESILRKHAIKVDLTGVSVAHNDRAILCEMKSSDRLYSLMIGWDATWTTAANADLGVWHVGHAENGVAVNSIAFGSDLDLGAAKVLTERFATAAAITLQDVGKPLWELLQLSEDPNDRYNLVVQMQHASPPIAGGVIEAQIEYTSNV